MRIPPPSREKEAVKFGGNGRPLRKGGHTGDDPGDRRPMRNASAAK
jgi:hypothetical protein